MNTDTHTDTHIPTPNERQKGMAGLTDQFPISPSRPEVIRSSCTWREAWIPLGFISSNYPLLLPHAVPSLQILYFSSGSWHCPLLPPCSLFFPHFWQFSTHTLTVSFIPPLNRLDGSFIVTLLSLSLFGYCLHVNPHVPAEGHSDMQTDTHSHLHTQIHILRLFLSGPKDEKAISVFLQ